MNIDELLSTTQPGLYEFNGEYKEHYPYTFVATYFAVRSNGRTYIVTARHCPDKWQLPPNNLLYPKHGKSDEFYAYDQVSTINAPDEKKYADLIAIRISEDENLSAIELPCLDITHSNSCIDLSKENANDVIIRGFPDINPNHSIDYDSEKIKYSGYITNKMVGIRKSKSEHCTYIKMATPIPQELASCNDKINASGMSGSPVYVLDKNIRFSGTIIEFNDLTNEYLIVNSYVIRELLRKST